MANSSGKRIKTFFGFIHQSLPLVGLCGMQIRSATSDPELERHFFPQKGKKGTKARAKITSIWRLQKLAPAFESVLHTAVKSGDVAGGGVSIRGQHREQTQLTDTQLRAGGSGKTLSEGGTATAKVTPSCTSDEVRICDEDVSSWRRVFAPAFGCQRAGGRKASLMRAVVWAGLPAGPQDGMGAEGPAFHLCFASFQIQKFVLHMHSCVCCHPRFYTSCCVTTYYYHHTILINEKPGFPCRNVHKQVAACC